MNKEYRINVGGSFHTNAMPLDEVAILMRVKAIRMNMEPDIQRSAKDKEMRIDDIRCLPQKEVDIVDADRAAMDFINRHGLVAFMKKVIKMTVDECGPRANWAYHTTTGKDMAQIGPYCMWCEDHNCANCPAFAQK